MDTPKFSKLANALIASLRVQETRSTDQKINVNPLVSTVASLYEQFRNAMDYREDEVVLRAAIERILKRRLMFGGSGQKVAGLLIRELLWARYFADNSLSESIIIEVGNNIDAYLSLRHLLIFTYKVNESLVNDWIYDLMSAQIEQILNKKPEKELVSSLMFQTFIKHVQIADDTQQTRDAQVFIAIRRAFARDDLAFLRYYLFTQLFGQLSLSNVEHVASKFASARQEIEYQLAYPRRETIYLYIKRKTAAFLILEDMLIMYKDKFQILCQDVGELDKSILAACEARYNGIASKIRRAIVRSVIFILCTKAIFALIIEGALDRMLFGMVMWSSLIIDTSIPPIIMIVVGLFIRPPGKDNSLRIASYIRGLLFDQESNFGPVLNITKFLKKQNPVLNAIFTIFWLLAFVLTFGIIIFILTKLNFNILSKIVLLFFLAIVSFFAYRITVISRVYAFQENPSLIAPIMDFLFMPIVKVGSGLSIGLSRFNVLVLIFDLFIEAPFKGLFGFFEQWFIFLHSKREGLE